MNENESKNKIIRIPSIYSEFVNLTNSSLKNANLSECDLDCAIINGYQIPKNAKFGIIGEGFSGPFYIFNIYNTISSFTVCTQIHNGKRVPWIFFSIFGNHKGGTIEEFKIFLNNDKKYIFLLEGIEKLYKFHLENPITDKEKEEILKSPFEDISIGSDRPESTIGK